jgi:hypothetical protein
MTKTKEKDKIEVVRINPVDDETEEVFLYREEPYVNEVHYAPKGLYKLGTFTEPTIEKKVQVEEEE